MSDDSVSQTCRDLVPPQAKRKVPPEYPRAFKGSGYRAIVILKAIVTERGKIKEIQVVLKHYPEFVEAATKALRRFRFKPAMCAGKQVEGEFFMTFNSKPQ